MWKLYIWLYALYWLLGLVIAGNQFQEPDGRLSDFEQTYTVGDTLNIKWIAGWFGSDEQPDFVDLFVTWFGSDSYSDLLVANTTTKQAGFYPWKINVTEDAVIADNEFVLRFRPHRKPEDYNNAGPMSPSRGFRLQLSSSASSSSSLSSSTTSSSASSSSSLSSSTTSSSIMSSTISSSSASVTTTAIETTKATKTPTATSGDPLRDKKPTPNVGAIVGGVIGGLGLIILCGIALLLWKLWNWKKEGNDGNFATFWAAQKYGQPQVTTEDPTEVTPEIDGRQLPVEAPGPEK